MLLNTLDKSQTMGIADQSVGMVSILQDLFMQETLLVMSIQQDFARMAIGISITTDVIEIVK